MVSGKHGQAGHLSPGVDGPPADVPPTTRRATLQWRQQPRTLGAGKGRSRYCRLAPGWGWARLRLPARAMDNSTVHRWFGELTSSRAQARFKVPNGRQALPVVPGPAGAAARLVVAETTVVRQLLGRALCLAGEGKAVQQQEQCLAQARALLQGPGGHGMAGCGGHWGRRAVGRCGESLGAQGGKLAARSAELARDPCAAASSSQQPAGAQGGHSYITCACTARLCSAPIK